MTLPAPCAPSRAAEGDNGQPHPLTRLAEETEGFSGSDLNELCSQAAMLPVHDAIRL